MTMLLLSLGASAQQLYAPSGTPLFGSPAVIYSGPAYGIPDSPPVYSTSAFGTYDSGPVYGAPIDLSSPVYGYGAVYSAPSYGTLDSAPLYSGPALFNPSGPLYSTPVVPPMPYGYAAVGQPAAHYYGPSAYSNAVFPPVAAPSVVPSAFDAWVAQRQVRITPDVLRGNEPLLNIPFSFLFPSTSSLGDGHLDSLSEVSQLSKGLFAAKQEDLTDDQIRYVRLTQNRSIETRNKLDDLKLQKSVFRNDKLRRAATLLPAHFNTGSPLANWFERNSHQDEMTLAQNSLADARKDYAQDPSSENWDDIREAQHDVRQAQSFRDANSYDLLGLSFGGAYKIAPILRRQGSLQGKRAAVQARQDASAAYNQNPTLENQLKLQIAIATVDAWKNDVNAHSDEFLANTLSSRVLKTFGAIGQITSFQRSSQAYARIRRLNRQLIRVQRTNAAQTGSPDDVVAQRMIALSTYGGGDQNVPFMSVQFARTN